MTRPIDPPGRYSRSTFVLLHSGHFGFLRFFSDLWNCSHTWLHFVHFQSYEGIASLLDGLLREDEQVFPHLARGPAVILRHPGLDLEAVP